MKCSQLFGLKMAESRTISESTFTKSENTSSDEEQEPPCRSVGRPRVPFEEASKKTKRRRVAELTTVRSANELQFAVNVVSGSNHSEVSPQVFSFSTAEALALMVDLDISICYLLLLLMVRPRTAFLVIQNYRKQKMLSSLHNLLLLIFLQKLLCKNLYRKQLKVYLK
ncbi:unnamed protein product [Acanthoscelides obtectus]|uniref:Uncharacterized protein n=1 Tax=Acanthoscelides obtectus TaxID=200917 RepID=A0A9P0PKU1_ACAOB|nr:unnamed protein product [Acanthoscelides obtectus]CAK1661729.1 hypothetical protein AOBTE_LOCUS22758 [Acanthoscelides obtectus]